MRDMLAVHGQPCAVALPLQLDFVPLTIAHVHAAHSDQSFAATQIEFVLHHAIHYLQDIVIHFASCVHEVAGRLQRSDPQ